MTTKISEKEFYKPIQGSWVSQSGLTKEHFEKEVSFAVQHINSNPKLQECEPNSLLKAVLNVAQTGLTLNPVSKYAYLIPRWNSKLRGLECVLEPSYMGLSKLLTDSRSVKHIESQVIYEGDEIEVDFASDDKIIKHVPYFLKGNDKGSIRGVYSKAKLSDGSFHCEIMSRADVDDIRERSESYKAMKSGKISTCIWVTDEAQMFRKTVIKRHFNQLPKSQLTEKVEHAISLDNQINGFDGPISWEFINYLEGMVSSTSFDDDKKQRLLDDISGIELISQGKKMAEYLIDNQKIVGLHTSPKSQKEAMEATRRAVNKDKS